ADIHKLLEVLHGFVDAGNTVSVVEHNLEVFKTADWIIDLGPDGGAGGGTIVVEGPPEKIATEPQSHTGRALREVLPGFKKHRSNRRKNKEGLAAKAAPAGRWQFAESDSIEAIAGATREI